MAIILKIKHKDLTKPHKVFCLSWQYSLYFFNFTASATMVLVFDTLSLFFLRGLHLWFPPAGMLFFAVSHVSLSYFILLFVHV